MCTAITLEEKSVDVVLDALRALKNEMLDNMNFSDESHNEIEKVESLFIKAKDSFSAAKVMAMEKQVDILVRHYIYYWFLKRGGL